MSESTPRKTELSAAEQALRDAALEYHRSPVRGKIAVKPTKALSNQRDLSLAYSPGVAYACLAIEEDPALAADFTSRGNLVGVVTNGTAVLGLGDIGPLAGKPVMEGKGCLFQKFAGIDVFDIELAERDPDKLVDIIAALEPTLGGVNLEDIKAPECFYIEKRLRERMNIPVFHDDQHGTAIISAAALLNGLELVGKRIGDVKIAVSGAGAAAIACLDLMVELGVRRENVFVCDSKGVIHDRREDRLDESKKRYQQKTSARTLADVMKGADVLLGCSAAGCVSADMVAGMADKPIILALANPEPEIRPELAKSVRPDCIIATGRSDYPNQVNNVLCFPYIFRGRVCRPRAALRTRLPDPDAVRLAAHPAHRAGGGQGRRGVGRRHPAHRRPEGLQAVADPLRHAHRHVHAAGVPGRARNAAARGLRRRRGRARAARGADRAR
jgi:malate dehydrogenase (oxaloacetate-decarboxylating)(NADP+)